MSGQMAINTSGLYCMATNANKYIYLSLGSNDISFADPWVWKNRAYPLESAYDFVLFGLVGG